MKKITVHGKENIPNKGAVLFIANHQNALIDAILIPTTTTRKIYFLARASAFVNTFVSKLLNSINMIPVYRIRDGVNTIEKNLDTFKQCFEILKNEGAIEIFAEGEHHYGRRIIPLKKGFARIILGTLQKYPDLEIQIIPVGINYDSHFDFPSSASVYYGEPINVSKYMNPENPDMKFSKIKNHVLNALKKLTLHVENPTNYDEIIRILENNDVDYLNPFEANDMVENIAKLSKQKAPKKNRIKWFIPFHLLAKLNSIFPLLIWWYLKSNIKEIIFANTYRFAVITTLFPLFYIIQTVIIYYFFNLKYAFIYLVSCIILGIISTKTMEVST